MPSTEYPVVDNVVNNEKSKMYKFLFFQIDSILN